jgi:hypothetical protein
LGLSLLILVGLGIKNKTIYYNLNCLRKLKKG